MKAVCSVKLSSQCHLTMDYSFGKILPAQLKCALLGILSQICYDSVLPSSEQLNSNVFLASFLGLVSFPLAETK